MNTGNKIMAVILIISLASVGIFYSYETEIRDVFATTITGGETLYINATEYINVIQYLNSTIYINTTEYIPYWINSTEYIYVPLWYNNTIWINSTTFINYPFVEGWNNSASENYSRCFKSIGGSAQYRAEWYDHLSFQIEPISYTSLSNVKTVLLQKLSTGNINIQQFDCMFIQLFILEGI